jgi:hypothetical protein
MGALRKEFPRCSKRLAIANLHNCIGAQELPARAEKIAAILHFLPPSGDVPRSVSKDEIRSALWRNCDRDAGGMIKSVEIYLPLSRDVPVR